ncbi:L,D-transpeptidase family protein [Massilia soli]|uniref:L,D-transpeptidase family protein n=1 Tax=Massilia soli TaxID=2792854 RepID=A0ABS7SL89_9BURK|nr:L,D-transpeptidase family protein [Massilia soli]
MIPCVLLLALLVNSGAAFAANGRATRVHVDKSDRLMAVYAGDRVIARYRIGLGTRPQGHKTQEGDRRTPEGRYTLDFKNATRPSPGKKRGVSPGGDIMIHGEANDPAVRKALRRSPYRDWTYGCIWLPMPTCNDFGTRCRSRPRSRSYPEAGSARRPPARS